MNSTSSDSREPSQGVSNAAPAHRETVASPLVNVARRLCAQAAERPDQWAVIMPRGRAPDGARRYDRWTFRELEDDSNRLAAGLRTLGAPLRSRLALLVRPSFDFISLVFALLKSGHVMVLIDPGMGRKAMIGCLQETRPAGFVAISLAQAVRVLLRHKFPDARHNVTVGRRWFWGGPTLADFRRQPASLAGLPATAADDPAAIIFTTGSTGPPKGVLYSHGNFDRQVDEIRDFYRIQPGEVDLPGFPLFALFNAAMGVTTVVPDMDFTRPARVDPRQILEAGNDWQVTQAFGSPALWNTVGRHCEKHGGSIPSLRRVLSAGAPVPPHVLRRIRGVIHPDGEVHTPYGATESLPVASIESREVLNETAAQTAVGRGTCVGRRFPGIEWKVLEIRDEPIATMAEAVEVPRGQIGELAVRGPVVTRQYVTRTDANALHKIVDGDTFWHRVGDVGYLDERDRFWFCGRKSHRVRAASGTMFTIPCEAIFNQHPRVYRSALVGVGPPDAQRPVVFVELWPERRLEGQPDQERLIGELRQLGAAQPHTAPIRDFLVIDAMPVDIRHNAKIFREQLALLAAKHLANRPAS